MIIDEIKNQAQGLLKLVFIAFLALSCNNKQQDNDAEETEIHEEEEGVVALTEVQYNAAGIKLGSIEQRQLSGTLKVNGLLDVPPQNQVSISVPLGGMLKSTDLLQGMWVKQGNVIARMQHPDYIEIQQNYLEAVNQLSFMEKEYKRQEELNEENVSADKVFQRTVAEYNSIKSKVDALSKKLALLNINASKLPQTGILQSIPLITPIDGYVTEVNANIGKYVAANEVIFEIVDTRHLHVELMVFEKDITKLKIGQKVRFTLANETDEKEAEIYLIGREISPERTVRVHAHLLNEDANLLPNMYLKAIIETGVLPKKALPNEAIVSFNGRDYLFVQIADEGKHDHDPESEATEEHEYKFQMLEIITGVSDEGYTEVTLPEGFNETSDSIVVKGAYDLLSKMNNSEEEGHGH